MILFRGGSSIFKDRYNYDVNNWDALWYGLLGLEHIGSDFFNNGSKLEKKFAIKAATRTELEDCCGEHIKRELKQAGINKICADDGIEIKLNDTKSNVVQRNNNTLYARVLKGLSGLIRKDNAHTWVFGRYTCEALKDKFSCGGYFTSDELPGGVTGITKEDIRKIYSKTGAKDSDLVLLFSYDRKTSSQMAEFLVSLFGELLGLDVVGDSSER